MSKTLIATYLNDTSYCNTLLFVLKTKDSAYSYLYILGILNSSLIGWYYRKKFQISEEDTFPQIMIRDILQFPIPKLNKTHHDQMERLVDAMLSLNRQVQKVSLPDEKEKLQRQIAATDKKIDQLVYELYGLTDEEIRIVEESGGS